MNLTRILSATFLGLCLLGSAGCGGGKGKVEFTGNQRAAGADGIAKWKIIAGGAILVELSMSNVPPPARLAPGMTTYVVWFAPEGRQANVAGTLEFDERNREGQMSATNPTKKFEIIVSAERNAQVASPGDHVIARFRIDAR